MNRIIGISGVAGSGKDTFFNLLSERVPCRKYSLADELKREVNQWSRMHYSIDSEACSREEKEVIRPFLVFHGATKRHASQGRHWINKLSDRMMKDKVQGFKIVTDIRYDEYENDEVSWLRNELNGILVHVSQFEYRREEVWVPSGEAGTLVKKYRDPINPEEARNDPRLKEKSDYQVEWEFIKNGQISELKSHIDDFIEWLTEDEETASRQHLNKQGEENRL
jgi:hypothetical protein